MTSAPIHNPISAASAHASDWLPLDEAARAMGSTAGAMRLKCGRDYAARGLARKNAAGEWVIHRNISPRLVRLAFERTTDGVGGAGISRVLDRLRSASPAKVIDATKRLDAVKRFRRWKNTPGVIVSKHLGAFLIVLAKEVGLDRISRSRLWEWDGRCGDTGDTDACLDKLIDSRGGAREGSESGVGVSEDAWDYFCKLYLTTQQWSVSKCYRIVADVAQDHGWSWPSISTIRNLIDSRLEPGTIALARDGEDAWAKKFLTPIEQDPDAFAAGECWEADNSTLDFFARHRVYTSGGEWTEQRVRPVLTAWIDRRTRRCVGWNIADQGNSGTIRAALLSALQRDDVSRPDHVWLDNGKDFASAAIGGMTKSQRRSGRASKPTLEKGWVPESPTRGVLGMLGIEAHFATPYNHNGKARIERFFGTVHTDFDREFASWCGSKPGDRDRDAISDATRDIAALPSLDEVRAAFEQWVTAYNARSEHRIDDLVDSELGRRLSPDEFYARHAQRKPMVDRDALRVLEQVFQRPRTVHKTGISVTIAGRVIRYGAGARGLMPQLERFVGSKDQVIVSYDAGGGGDTRTVTVWDTDYRLICIAPENDSAGGVRALDVPVRKAAWSAQRAARKQAKAKIDLAALTLTDAQLAAKIARDRAVAETRDTMRRQGLDGSPSAEAPLTLVRTPVDGQAKALERAEMRQAVGAETTPTDPDPVDLRLTQWIDEADDETGTPDDGLSDEDIAGACSGFAFDGGDDDDILDVLAEEAIS